MSNRFFQSVVYQLKDSIDRTVGVIDENGTVISCSDLIKIGEVHENVISSISATMESIVEDGYTYKPLNSRSGLEYVAFVVFDFDLVVQFELFELWRLMNLVDLFSYFSFF